MDSENWFALYTKPHKEYVVRNSLTGQGIEVYLPEIRTSTRRPGRRGTKPFFPHYLFARFDLQDGAMAKVRWTPGLRRIVCFGDRPAPIPDEVVAHIRRRLATMVERQPEAPFEQGEVVHILHGPFEGLDAIFDRSLPARGRVRVLLSMMSRQVAAELDLEDLVPPY